MLALYRSPWNTEKEDHQMVGPDEAPRNSTWKYMGTLGVSSVLIKLDTFQLCPSRSDCGVNPLNFTSLFTCNTLPCVVAFRTVLDHVTWLVSIRTVAMVIQRSVFWKHYPDVLQVFKSVFFPYVAPLSNYWRFFAMGFSNLGGNFTECWALVAQIMNLKWETHKRACVLTESRPLGVKNLLSWQSSNR